MQAHSVVFWISAVAALFSVTLAFWGMIRDEHKIFAIAIQGLLTGTMVGQFIAGLILIAFGL